MTFGELMPVHDSVMPKTSPTRPPATRARTQITASITRLTTTALAKKMIVATMLADEPSEVPLRPLPAVQPPAVLAPKPISTPVSTSSAATRIVPAPLNVSAS